tara:strand:+ start:3138 stop:4394 length:1257 start_codon:yes stop_codon:yes gene_type:complete
MFLSHFNDVFEKCNIHNLKYTEQLFKKEFPDNFYDLIILDPSFEIKSGSIAQVYKAILRNTNKEVAIKVTHPNLNEQMLFPYLYFIIYNKLTINIPFLRKYRTPFEMSEFFKNFYKQIDMINEAKNLKYFHKNYKNNPFIVIPKPIVWSKNILIMEYIEGILFTELKVSDYIKNKIIMILNLFIKNSMFLCNRYHADLHNSNWSVIIENKQPKIIIYDLGFCIETTLEERTIQQKAHKSIDLNDQKTIAECLYKYLSRNPTNMDMNTFVNYSLNFMKDNKYNLYNTQSLKYLLSNYTKNNFMIKSNIFNVIITLLLIDNHLKKYLYRSNVDTDNTELDENYICNKIKMLHEQLNNYLLFCQNNNCFYLLQKYLSNYIEEVEELINNNINIDLHNNIKKYKTIKNRTTHISIETNSIDI